MLQQIPDCKNYKTTPIPSLRHSVAGTEVPIPGFFSQNKTAKTLELATDNNEYVGTYKFYVDYTIAVPDEPDVVLLGARTFSIAVLPRPMFVPYFSEPLNGTIGVDVNKEIAFKLPPYGYYWQPEQ